MRTVLVCVRTPVAAQAIAVAADRIGLASAVRTAVTGVEVLARLAERPADVILVDSALAEPDLVGFVRQAIGYAPGAILVLFGLEDTQLASAAIAAGARGVIRGGDGDLVTSVTKTLLLLCQPAQAPRGPNGGPPNGRPLNGGPPGGGPSNGGPPGGGPSNGGPPAGPASTLPVPAPAGPVAVAQVVTVEAPPLAVPAQREHEPRRPRRPALTERELQVLYGMADGKSNAEIGRDLFVSEDTVKTHARRLFRKLGARDRAHAVASAFRAGLVT